MDKVKTDLIEAKEIHAEEKLKLKASNDEEKAEIVKKLTLEHEIELDALREELENSEKVANCEAEVKRLREILHLKESDVEALRRKTRLLEMNQEERFHEEKEKIVQILEAGFSQRERLSLQKCEDDIKAKFSTEMQGQKQNLELEKAKALDKLRQDMQKEFQETLASMEKGQSEMLHKSVQKATEELRQKFEEDKNESLKLQHKQLTKKSKCEIDALRKRFKMMQTTGAFDRSPSCSESELSIEVKIYY